MTQSFPFADLYKNWESAIKDATSNLPQPDFAFASELLQKQAQANAEITKLVTESIQDVAQKSAESAQKNFEKSVKLFNEVASAKDPRESVTKQAEFSKALLEDIASEAQELAEVATKSSAKVYELANKQFNDGLKQFGETAKKAQSAAKPASKNAA